MSLISRLQQGSQTLVNAHTGKHNKWFSYCLLCSHSIFTTYMWLQSTLLWVCLFFVVAFAETNSSLGKALNFTTD